MSGEGGKGSPVGFSVGRDETIRLQRRPVGGAAHMRVCGAPGRRKSCTQGVEQLAGRWMPGQREARPKDKGEWRREGSDCSVGEPGPIA